MVPHTSSHLGFSALILRSYILYGIIDTPNGTPRSIFLADLTDFMGRTGALEYP